MNTIKNYLKKIKGNPSGLKLPPRPSLSVLLSSFAGAFLGISIACGVSTLVASSLNEDPIILGSIGAMAVLIYGTIDAPLAQPRNLVLGNFFSALLGVLIQEMFSNMTGSHNSFLWLKAGLAVSLSLTVMQLTQTVHPPAGATALIAVTGGPRVFASRFYYLLLPVALNISILLFIALAVNNVKRQYPKYWWDPEMKLYLPCFIHTEKVSSNPVIEEDVEMVFGAVVSSVPEPTIDELKHRIELLQKRIHLLESKQPVP
ncbi:hypothetical protein DSO57_1026766 [Entomophthora muscae]|uniref:Uncharacterized protein n=1 Tax=Entomophthora muscae TaxID=34485 RepID=A0ACC2TPH7_9FUNG|nr:hypothetical protein DSO57_1026766 [Entomophthora muscae]